MEIIPCGYDLAMVKPWPIEMDDFPTKTSMYGWDLPVGDVSHNQMAYGFLYDFLYCRFFMV